MNVKIYGAGSIGNHLAHGCRSQGWAVTMVDLDRKALDRTRTEIYPARYGKWDESIRLATPAEAGGDPCDLAIIGTPPDTHLKIAFEILRKNPPKALLVEKPLCTPSLEGAAELWRLARETGTFVAVGYNHTLTPNTDAAAALLQQNWLGKPLTVSAAFREYWGGIFAAHPWLAGPKDSYLGFWQRGGGASGEHSHAINIWQHFSHLLGMGRVVEVSAMLEMVSTDGLDYDRLCQINVRTEKGLTGLMVQDVVTEPAQKNLRVQGEGGFLEWQVNYHGSQDALFWQKKGSAAESQLFPKKRPDDFQGEIVHLGKILGGADPVNSPISLQRGLDTMMVVAAAHVSARWKKTVTIEYDKGYGPEAIQPI